jgi:hypothetical protein
MIIRGRRSGNESGSFYIINEISQAFYPLVVSLALACDNQLLVHFLSSWKRGTGYVSALPSFIMEEAKGTSLCSHAPLLPSIPYDADRIQIWYIGFLDFFPF